MRRGGVGRPSGGRSRRSEDGSVCGRIQSIPAWAWLVAGSHPWCHRTVQNRHQRSTKAPDMSTIPRMARRRRKEGWEDVFLVLRELFRFIHPAWSIPLAAVVFALPVAWFQLKVEQPALRQLGFLFGGIPAAVILGAGFAGWQARRGWVAFQQTRIDISWLNSMTWRDFERLVGDMYRADGFMVSEPGRDGADGGVDLWLWKDEKTTIVQCKRWRTYKVGVGPVRELYGVMMAEKADRAVFITSGVYTDEALEFASDKPLHMMDGAQLATILKRFQPSGEAAAAAVKEVSGDLARTTLPTQPTCPRCGAEMVLRRARRGQNAGKEFWGCSGFPKCRAVVEVG